MTPASYLSTLDPSSATLEPTLKLTRRGAPPASRILLPAELHLSPGIH
jgi:hypothetical protein